VAQLDRNLHGTSSDSYVRNYLQGIDCATKQLALFSWASGGSVPTGRPFQGTGYWPAYFADLMRRVLAETAKHPRGVYDHGTFTFDSYIAPDGGNSGLNSDTFVFTADTAGKPKMIEVAGRQIQTIPQRLDCAEVGEGRSIPVVKDQVALEKDVRHLVRFVGMMTHRLAGLPEQEILGHRISGVMSKYWDRRGSVYETGNGDGDEHRFWMLLYDHNPSDPESQDRAIVPLTLQVRNLPKEANSARVTVYRVDRDHSSIFTLTERIKPNHGPTYSPSEIAALKQKAALAKDEDFAGNGTAFAVSNGGLDLPLTLGTNRVLFVEVDRGKGAP